MMERGGSYRGGESFCCSVGVHKWEDTIDCIIRWERCSGTGHGLGAP